jgi:hypothetical protein
MSVKNNWWVAAVVVIVAAIGLIYVGGLGSKSENKKPQNVDAGDQPLKTIVAKRTFENGTHIITGVIDLPSPCHGLSIETTVTQTYPEQVALNFNSSTTAETCAQVETPVQFREEFKASGYAIIRAYWNGELARLQFVD